MRKNLIFLTFVCLIIIPAIHAEKRSISDLAQKGRELFYDATFGGNVDPRRSTGMSCATCHADFDESEKNDGLIRSAHSIIGVPSRGKSVWTEVTPETFARTAGGAGVCYERFLKRTPKTKIDPTAIPESAAKALMSYFEFVSDGEKSPEVKLQAIDKSAAESKAKQIISMKGDQDRGWKIYGRACAKCHPTPKRAGIGSQLVRSRPPANLEKRLIKIASYVRTGGSTMPAIGDKKLSDQALADLVKFIEAQNRRK